MTDFISTIASQLMLAQTTASTATSFAALIPTATKPLASATRSVLVLTGPNLVSRLNTLAIWPFGTDSDADVGNWKVTGWISTKSGLYVPTPLCEFQGSMSSALPGIAGYEAVVADLFCDNITLTTGYGVIFKGTTDLDVAHIEVPVGGYELAELTYDLGSGGVNLNALWRLQA